MADDQDASKEVGDEVDPQEPLDYDEPAEVPAEVPAEIPAEVPAEVPPATGTEIVPEKSSAAVGEEYYDDEPIEDYVVKLVVNDESDFSTTSKDLVDAAITDINGDLIPSKSSEIIDALNNYSTAIYDELNGQTTAITDGGKKWWGLSTRNFVIFGLILLCIIGLILAFVFIIIGKKRKNKRTTAGGSSSTTKNVVTKGVSPDSKYQQVPNV